MMTRWLVRALLGATVVSLIFVSLYSVFWGLTPDEQLRYSGQVRRLHSLDTVLNQAVLRAHSGLLLSYDPLVFAVRESEKTHRELLDVPENFPRDRASELSERVEQSRLGMLRKAESIEQFKTENAVLRTSLHYFPVLVANVADHAVAQQLPRVGARVQAVGSAVMLFETISDYEAKDRVLTAQSALEGDANQPELSALHDDLLLVNKHASIILERKPRVDRLVRTVLGMPTADEQLQIEKLYSELEANALGAAVARRQWMLGLICGVAILGMLEILGNMRRSAAARELLTAELRAAHAKLAEEHEKERQLSGARSRFLAMTSHEIRTPLTAISSSAEMLESFGEKWGPDRRLDHVRRIREAAASMGRMVEDVLLIGRADAGGLRPAPAPILLSAFCQELIEALEQQCQGTHSICHRFEGDAAVSLDERLLRHVLGNLLSNAIKYSPEGSSIEFSVKAWGDVCEFLVSDSGIGIPKEHMPSLFLSYSRAKNVEHLSGSGLGLAVVERSVAAQGGTIACQSEEGRGTKFVVRIPRHPPGEQGGGVSAV